MSAAPIALPTPDWLFHHVAVLGPDADRLAFRQVAAGAGTIPWHLDLDRLEEDIVHRLLSMAACAPGDTPELGLEGARVLAAQLRQAVGRRHTRALARAGVVSCPLDLHALLPVPEEVLRLGPDDPASLAWLWAEWGTTQALRRVSLLKGGEGVERIGFWSADWTPWRAFRTIGARWPTLRFEVRPIYDDVS